MDMTNEISVVTCRIITLIKYLNVHIYLRAQAYGYGTHAIALVRLPPTIGMVLDQVMEWASDDIEVAMLVLAEAQGYGQLTSNQSKFCVVE